MRKLLFLLPLILLTWASCTSQPAAPGQRTTGESEAARQRNQYEEKAEAKLRELNRRIAELNAKAGPQARSARKQLDRQIAELDKRRAALQQQLEKFKNTSQEAWRDAKPGIDAAMRDLEDAYQRAAADFKQSH
jgi:Zn-dependent M32 family carboxypeptidase